MNRHADPLACRRQFLKFLAASPLLFREMPGLALQETALVKSAAEALNVFDFEPVAKQKIPPAHWGYMATGVDDDATLRQPNRLFTFSDPAATIG